MFGELGPGSEPPDVGRPPMLSRRALIERPSGPALPAPPLDPPPSEPSANARCVATVFTSSLSMQTQKCTSNGRLRVKLTLLLRDLHLREMRKINVRNVREMRGKMREM